jgi:hypothetical protein
VQLLPALRGLRSETGHRYKEFGAAEGPGHQLSIGVFKVDKSIAFLR